MTPRTPNSDYHVRSINRACRRLSLAVRQAEALRAREGQTATDVFAEQGRTFTVEAIIQADQDSRIDWDAPVTPFVL